MSCRPAFLAASHRLSPAIISYLELSEFNLADKMEEVIRFKTNDQLNQFSSMYFNKVKKDLIIYGL